MTRDSFGKKHRVFREGWMKRQKFLFIFVVLGAKIWQRSRGTIPPKLGTKEGLRPHFPYSVPEGGLRHVFLTFFQKICCYFWNPTRVTKHDTWLLGTLV